MGIFRGDGAIQITEIDVGYQVFGDFDEDQCQDQGDSHGSDCSHLFVAQGGYLDWEWWGGAFAMDEREYENGSYDDGDVVEDVGVVYLISWICICFE